LNRTGTPQLLRAINDRAALDLLLRHGSLSRTQLGELTGLSKVTASQLLGRLEADGLVVPVGMSTGARGPGAQLYAVAGSVAHVAAVDVIPSQLTVTVADLAGRVTGEAVVRTGRGGGADPVGDIRRGLVAATAAAGVSGVDHVVIGAPGVYDPTTDRLAHATHLTTWSKPGVLSTLQDLLGVPVDLENNVNLAAIAERDAGVARDVDSFAMLWVSAGLGMAIDLGGTLHRGATGGAGEIGYMPVAAAPGQARGRRFQDLVGGPAVLRLAKEHGFNGRTAEVAVRRAAAAGPAGKPLLTELSARLATGLSTIVAVLDPSLVVLTGDVALAGGTVLRGLVERRLRDLTPLRPRVALSAVDGNAVTAGALVMALGLVRDVHFGSPHSSKPHPARTKEQFSDSSSA
jgi:predicted NBD/HSP70 family sugar kinase